MTQSVDQAMLRAKTLIKNGDLHAARQVYAALLERYPGNKRAAEALNALAGARPGKNVAAAGAPSGETQLQALLDLYRQGRLQDALRMGTELAAKFPQVPQIPNILGAVNTMLGRVPEAIASYRNAVRLDPSYAEAHHNLGNALRAMGQKNEALASFAKAIQLRPGYAEAHRNLSTLKTFTVDDPQIAVLNRLLVAVRNERQGSDACKFRPRKGLRRSTRNRHGICALPGR